MSKYTTEVRFICEQASGLTESKGYNDTNSIIDLAIPKVFNFDFPIFDEKYRVVLERKILKHFYTREIGEETVGLWNLRLDTRLNEIMPYYNKLYKSELLEFNPLYTANLTRTKKTDYDSNRNENENISDTSSSNRTTSNNGTVNNTTSNKGTINITTSEISANTGEVDTTNNGTTTGTGSGTSTNTNIDLYSDTPQGALSGVEAETYLTNARKTTDNGSTSSNTSNTNSSTGKVESSENGTTSGTHNTTSADSGTNDTTSTNNGTDNSTGTYGRTRDNTDALTSTEDYLETVVGYEGAVPSVLLLKYRDTFLNIDMMIINNLEDLFFQLW